MKNTIQPTECKHCGTTLSHYKEFCDQFCRKAYAEDNGDKFEELYAPIIRKGHQLQLVKQALDKITELYIPSSLSLHVTSFADSVTIKFKHLDALHDARVIAKLVYPHWKDELNNIWHSCDCALAAWKDPNFPAIELWLETTVANFPTSLGKNENCGWKKQVSENYVYTCGVN